MSDNTQLVDTVKSEIQRQLHEHFFEQAVMYHEIEIRELEKMVLGELPSMIQSGIHEIIHVHIDSKFHANK